jgi:hypothetical protein
MPSVSNLNFRTLGSSRVTGTRCVSVGVMSLFRCVRVKLLVYQTSVSNLNFRTLGSSLLVSGHGTNLNYDDQKELEKKKTLKFNLKSPMNFDFDPTSQLELESSESSSNFKFRTHQFHKAS